ncbi:MAG: hypothetical protein AAFR27_15145 [Pseudomonadota bacterium]
MLELMNGGYQVLWLGAKGKFSRDLVKIVLADGSDAGQRLINEGFAQPWPNSGNPWCR